ncbi:MAG: TadE/TadG family type IV pilus assembly protein [Pseudomonadota bacterium]
MMRFLNRLARDTRGAALVEFSLVAFPLIILIMGTIELGFVYWGTKELENATNHGARFIRVGTAQNSSWTAAQLKTEICSQTAVLIDCNTRLRVDVRSAVTFSSFPQLDPLDSDGNLKSDGDFSYQPGQRNDVVLVSTFYQWRTFLGGGLHLMQSAAPMRNEPF